MSVDAQVLGARPAGSLLVAKYLLPAERVVWAQRRHWVALGMPLAVVSGGLIVALVLDVALPPSAALPRDLVWLAWSAAVWYLGWRVLTWWVDRFVVTDKRVLLVHGLLRRDVDMMPLTKVTDMRYERSVLGRLLGYGVFVMESAGKGQALSRVGHIKEPDWLYREICTLLFTSDQPARVPVTSPTSRAAGASTSAGWAGYGPSDPDPEGPRD
jgi:uncharacterized membrane protein YdbT with pleckstrin-like domain